MGKLQIDKVKIELILCTVMYKEDMHSDTVQSTKQSIVLYTVHYSVMNTVF